MAGRVRVVVVGNINIDLLLKAPRMPQEGETLLAEDLKLIPGGKGANQAVAASRLGGEVVLIGRVGDDPFGAMLLENLKREAVGLEFVRQDAEATTGTAIVMVGPDGHNRILTALGANNRCSIEDINAASNAIERADIALVQLGVPLEVVDHLIEVCRVHQVPVVLDAGPIRDRPPRRWSEVDILSPNASEAQVLTGQRIEDIGTAGLACRKLLEAGAKTVVMKMGEKGALLARGNELYHFEAMRVPVVDTTAAGDAFTAGLALAWRSGQPLEEAVRYANCVGALAVTRWGAQPSLPMAEEVAAFSAAMAEERQRARRDD